MSIGGGRVTAFFSTTAPCPGPVATMGGGGDAALLGPVAPLGAEPSNNSVERLGSARKRSAAVGSGGVCTSPLPLTGCAALGLDGGAPLASRRGTPTTVGMAMAFDWVRGTAGVAAGTLTLLDFTPELGMVFTRAAGFSGDPAGAPAFGSRSGDA